MAQTKLTKEQAEKFYAEYVRIKTTGNYAGEVDSFPVWKNQVEQLLFDTATGKNWSNTEIRRATHQIARSSAWSRKQIRTLERNLAGPDMTEELNAIMDYFGTTDIAGLVRHNQGAVYQFLKMYDSNWQRFFNS